MKMKIRSQIWWIIFIQFRLIIFSGRAALWSAIYLIGYHKWGLGWILVPVSFGAIWKWRSITAKKEESILELDSTEVLPR